MLTNQLIVGNVRVESSNQIIAILKGACDLEISLPAVSFRISKPIHPMARPAFAEMGRSQQSVNRFRYGSIGTECMPTRLEFFISVVPAGRPVSTK